MKTNEQMDIENKELKVGNVRYVILARNNDLNLTINDTEFDSCFTEYHGLEMVERDSGMIVFRDNVTGEQFVSERFKFYKTEDEAINFCKITNKNLIQEIEKFSKENGILF